jgi:hypothetical protein
MSPDGATGPTQSQAVTTGGNQERLELTYEGPGGTHAAGHAYVDGDGNIKVTRNAVGAPLRLGVFLGARLRTPVEDADRFSALAKRREQDLVLPALQALEPKLKGLAVLSIAGAPVIHADVGLSELLPVPLLGDGFVRLLSVLLAITAIPQGVALIDEVENGMHHTVLQRGLAAIAEAATRFDVQVFMTTHSYECIEAAHAAFSERSDYCLRILQLFRLRNGVESRVMGQEQIAAALDGGIDLR